MNIKSIIRNLKLAIYKRPLPLEKPTVIQFPVIDICNSKCQMCRIWENKKSKDITIEQLNKGLSSDLFSEVRGIGFNGGEPTLRKDLCELLSVVIEKLPKLTNVSLITNAFKVHDVIEQVENFSTITKQNNIHLDVMVSLDGYMDVHDKVRGRTGNFENAIKVLTYLKSSPNVDKIRIGCTVIKENVYHLRPLLEFCIQNDLYIKYRQGVPHQRLYTENLIEPYALTFEEKYEFVEFLEGLIKYYEKSEHQVNFYRSLIGQIINDAPRSIGCDWQHRGATITAKGELAYCAVKSKALMSDISDGDPLVSYFGNKEHLNNIIKNECSNCHHDYVGIPDRKLFLKNLIHRLFKKININHTRELLSPLLQKRNELAFDKNIKTHLSHTIDKNFEFKDSTKKILICGWYGTETLGDKAIIGGIMHTFRKKYGEDIQFVVVALHRYITEMTKRQMHEFRNTTIVSTLEGAALASSMDFVIFGGGPIMGINELAPMQAIFENAKKTNVKTIIASAGVGPFGDKWHNESIKKILELSDIRIYRDKRSKDYAESLGINTELDCVAEDPAFTWLSSINNNIQLPKINNEEKILLLGLRDFPYQEYARHLSVDEALTVKRNYEINVIKALEILLEKIPNLIIKPLPMCTNHFGSDDRWFYNKLFRNQELLKNNLDLSLLGNEMDPLFYCKEFVRADALLAMRFHSLVFGIGLGINSVALDYTLGKGKVKSLAERYNSDLISMLDIDAVNLADTLYNALLNDKPLPLSNEQLTFSKILDKVLK